MNPILLAPDGSPINADNIFGLLYNKKYAYIRNGEPVRTVKFFQLSEIKPIMIQVVAIAQIFLKYKSAVSEKIRLLFRFTMVTI
jgi:hypothetical protein